MKFHKFHVAINFPISQICLLLVIIEQVIKFYLITSIFLLYVGMCGSQWPGWADGSKGSWQAGELCDVLCMTFGFCIGM